MKKVIREVKSDILAKAIKSVDDEVKDKIFRNMSPWGNYLFKNKCNSLGPIRLEEVENCQKIITDTIKYLQDNNLITIENINQTKL